MDGTALTQMPQLHWYDTIASQADQSLWIALGFHRFVHDRIATKMETESTTFCARSTTLRLGMSWSR